jgi:hypothetical protein
MKPIERLPDLLGLIEGGWMACDIAVATYVSPGAGVCALGLREQPTAAEMAAADLPALGLPAKFQGRLF